MDNLNLIEKVVSVKRPQRRMCPRCHSRNTKLCNNHTDSSQPRYTCNCKRCRRCWTHGEAFRNVPIGGRCRKTERPKTQVKYVVLALPIRSVPPMERMDVSDGSFHYGYYDVGSNGANQEDPNQRFNNTMNIGSRSSYHGP